MPEGLVRKIIGFRAIGQQPTTEQPPQKQQERRGQQYCGCAATSEISAEKFDVSTDRGIPH